jgi:CRISPR/Cas system-associated exonuclease Cas4 (RecB family)
MNIESIYHDYLVHLENKREKTKKLFHASAAGSCLRKQMYNYYDYPQDKKDNRSYRILRLGTVVHSDIADAMELHVGLNSDNSTMTDKNIGKIYVEEPVEIKELNVVGTFDLGESTYWHDNKTKFTLYDVKTAAAYKWTTMFGRKENRKPNSSNNYKLQLGTYALGIEEKYAPDKIEMYLLWYNKNTSHIREQLISPEWVDKALEYWTEVNEILNDCGEDFAHDLDPGLIPGVPFSDWECKYCQFYSICSSTLADKK